MMNQSGRVKHLMAQMTELKDQTNHGGKRSVVSLWLLSSMLLLTALGAVALGVLSWEQRQQLRILAGQQVAMHGVLMTQQDQIHQAHQQLKAWLTQRHRLGDHTALMLARQLVIMAQVQLQQNYDAKRAAQLLVLASKQINPQDHPALVATYNLMSTEQKGLSQAPQLDIEALTEKYQRLQQSLPKVTQVPKQLEPVKAAPLASNHDSALKDKPLIKRLMGHLSHVFSRILIVQKTQQPVRMMISPDQFMLLKNQLLVQINLAEWALVNHQQQLMLDSLSQAQHLAIAHLPQRNREVQAIQDTLVLLQKVNTAPTLPSLDILIRRIDQQMQLHIKPASS